MANDNSRLEQVTLHGAQLEHARKALGDIIMGAQASHRLAIDACDNEHGEWSLVGIENIAKVTARKADMLLKLLGQPIGMGNFAEEFAPLSQSDIEQLEQGE